MCYKCCERRGHDHGAYRTPQPDVWQRLSWTLPAWARRWGDRGGRYLKQLAVGLAIVTGVVVLGGIVPWNLGDHVLTYAGARPNIESRGLACWIIGIALMSTFWWAPKLGKLWLTRNEPKPREPAYGDC